MDVYRGVLIIVIIIISSLVIRVCKLVEKNQELMHLAFFDSMTGFYNRRGFENLIKNEIAMIRKYGFESCILILDLDCFKEMNDCYGHPAGDMVIEQIVSLLRRETRSSDEIARWGGDEFMILLSHTSIEECNDIAERLRITLERNILLINERELNITSSFGLAKLDGNENKALEAAYIEADKALYLAKGKGGNSVETAY